MTLRFRSIFATCLLTCSLVPAFADGPPAFDLKGPALKVTVTRADVTLPIAQVPNLATGDVVDVKADFPAGQAAHYLMVVAFLRGSTNPPPESWFAKRETWNKKEPQDINVTVPEGAQQVLVFLAPETGGDFRTLVNAVRGRPGAFVRASQDLNQAGLDRSRLDAYLGAVRQITAQDPSKLKEAVPLLARSLDIKVDPKCFDKATEEQAPCLMQNQDAIILSDGHSTSIVQALTSGPAGDLATQLTYTPQANYGGYSPYVQSVMDVARIFDSLHTAQYQYIPALASLHGDEIALMLNVPPSFHNPKSVLVIALPAVEKSQPPPLHASDAKQTYCAAKHQVALGVEGAPLIFSTAYAHDTVLRVKSKDGKDGKEVELPVKADAQKGGLVLASDKHPADAAGKATLHGMWGFEPFDGPEFSLSDGAGPQWSLVDSDHQALVAGREDVVHLHAGDASCVDEITLHGSDGKDEKLQWKAVKPDEVEVTLPLKSAKAGDLQLKVHNYGAADAEDVPLKVFAEPGRLDSFNYFAGDTRGVLKGSRLEDAEKVELHGVEFLPEPGAAGATQGEMVFQAQTGKDTKALAAITAGQTMQAHVVLKDGRRIDLNVTVGAPRPEVALIGKSTDYHAAAGVQMGSADELPATARLTFSIRSKKGELSRDASVEVATADESYTTTLSAKDGTLTREDRTVSLARLDPAKAFGASAFGPLRFRVVDRDAHSDWQPLTTLVRLPELRALQCAAAADQPCTLQGDSLFLLSAVAADAAFEKPAEVADGFPGSELPVPHPAQTALYVKLRDDPSVIHPVVLPITTSGPASVPAVTTQQPVQTPAHQGTNQTTGAPVVAPAPTDTAH